VSSAWYRLLVLGVGCEGDGLGADLGPSSRRLLYGAAFGPEFWIWVREVVVCALKPGSPDSRDVFALWG
jgi:hypothetical protein